MMNKERKEMLKDSLESFFNNYANEGQGLESWLHRVADNTKHAYHDIAIEYSQQKENE